MIRCEQLERRFAQDGEPFYALRGVDLHIQAGELVASGSGKSTLMNLIGALDQPSGGRLQVADQELTRLTPPELASFRNQRVGFVFQQFQLLPRHTALRNVELPLLYAGLPAALRRQRALTLLERLGVGAQANKLPAQMSGGQQQRVAIARALAVNAPLLLADEPTGALDSASGAAVLDLLKQLHREQGRTVLIVTHDPGVAAACHRQLRFADGCLQSDSAAC
jgi:putative ABC transport system ATP-binding protein